MDAVVKMKKKFWGFLSCLEDSLNKPYDPYYYEESMDLIFRDLYEHPNAKAIVKRPGMKVYLNPDILSFSKFKEKVEYTKKRWEGRLGRYENCKEGASADINPLCGLGVKKDPSSYGNLCLDQDTDREWYAYRNFCLVGFREDSLQPMGHAGFNTALSINSENRTAYFYVSLKVVWVAPRWRGLAVGTDIMATARDIFGDLYRKVARETPEGWKVWADVAADYESFGGEKMTESLYEEIAFQRELLIDEGEVKATLDTIGLDAGF